MTTAALPYRSAAPAPAPVDAAAPQPALRVDNVDGGLLLRTRDDPTGALRLLTRAVVSAHVGQSAVVCADAVSRRTDVFEVLAQRLEMLRRAANHDVRLVLLGAGPDRDSRERGYRELARRIGRVVTGPTAPVMVASDGCLAAASSSDGAGGWLLCDGDGVVAVQPPWSPAPPWSPIPVLGEQLAGGRIVAHAVPAGVWLLPRGIAPNRAGVVPNLPRDPAAMSIFVGGGVPALDTGDVVAAVEALGLPHSARLILLPGALRPGRRPLLPDDLAYRARVAVPALGSTGWRLVAVTPEGAIVADAPADDPRWTDDRGGGLADAEPTSESAGWLGPPPGRRTPAGWSFVDGPTIGFTPATAGTVVEVAPEPSPAGGFTVAGRTLTPPEFADLLRATVGACAGGVVLIGGPYAVPAVARLSESLGATVAVSTGPVALTADGTLRTSGVFRVWQGTGPANEVGAVLPAGTTGVDPASLTRAVARTAAVPVVRSTSASVQTPPKPRGLRWPRAAKRTDEDSVEDDADARARLLRALPNSYRQHVAHVTAVLNSADSPVPAHLLIDQHERERVTAGLVAVRAYWSEYRTAVDSWLRGGSRAPGDAQIVAEWARAGLDVLPAVSGPVFTSVDGWHAYEPAAEVTEPGFVEAGLAPAAFPEDGLDYAIWSTTARRLGRAIHSGEPTALFPPGARFRVLDVERLGRRCRVFLAEVTGSAPPDDVLARLRAAAGAPATAPVVATSAAIGS